MKAARSLIVFLVLLLLPLVFASVPVSDFTMYNTKPKSWLSKWKHKLFSHKPKNEWPGMMSKP